MATSTFGKPHPDPNHDHFIRPAAYAIVFDESQQIACVMESAGIFLPGGGIEPGEDAIAAVHREVAEECAREIEIIRQLDSAIQFHGPPDGPRIRLEASFFLARFTGQLERQPDLPFAWRATEPALPNFYHPCHRWAVEGVLRTVV